MDIQRHQSLYENRQAVITKATTMYLVTVFHENLEITVTIQQPTAETTIDLIKVNQLVSDYMTKTDQTNFSSMTDEIYFIVSSYYLERDIEVMIYDTTDHLAIMKIYKFNQRVI